MSILARAIDILSQSDEDLLNTYERSKPPKYKRPRMKKVFDPTSPESVYDYAVRINERVPEYEDIILQDPRHAFIYVRDVIKDRWPEAEDVIAQDSFYAYLYAADVIKDRWPEAEDVIKQDPFYWRKYKEMFNM